jgi:hypothetical protein
VEAVLGSWFKKMASHFCFCSSDIASRFFVAISKFSVEVAVERGLKQSFEALAAGRLRGFHLADLLI